MKVVILCGGQGTRIRGVSEDIPKPMLTVGGRPILWHIMKHYASYGYDDFVLCLGYKGQVIKDYFLNYQHWSGDVTVRLGLEPEIEYHSPRHDEEWTVTLVDTGDNTQTGGRVSHALSHVPEDETFMLTYGDGLTNLSIDGLLESHRLSGAVLTVTGVMPPGRFGEIQCDSTGAVTGFNEKPQVSGALISGGFFVCEPGIRNYLSGEPSEVFEGRPLTRLVEDRKMAVHRHEGFWQCMDTPRDWSYLNDLFETGRAPWVRW